MNSIPRKILLSTFTILATLCQTKADVISKTEALSAAAAFFGNQETKSGFNGLNIVWDGIGRQTKSNVAPPYYVITRDGGGFVIIAANDFVTPILGFSMDNSFDAENIPDEVAAVMSQMGEYCRSFTSQSDEVSQQWKNLLTATATSSVTDEYLGSRTVQWEQGAPFNNKAPIKSGYGSGSGTLPGDHGSDTRYAAGCVPIALAEILTWFGAPEKGDGSTHTIYGGGLTTVTPTNTLNTVYDWDGLQSILTIDDTKTADDTLLDNMAQLILDCGTVAGAVYGSSTSVDQDNIINAFVNHMTFSDEANMKKPSNWTATDWVKMMTSEVSKRPVLCCGYAYSGLSLVGHAFVIDGYAKYDQQTLFHINFGWGPSYNGYYHDIYHPEAGGNDFCEYQVMFFDFYPLSKADTDWELSFTDAGEGGTGLRLTSGTTPLTNGSSISVAYDYISVKGSTYSGKLYLCQEDKNGNVKSTVAESGALNLTTDKVWSSEDIEGGKSGTVSNVSFGDRLALYYCSKGSETPDTRIETPKDGTVVLFAPCTPVTFIRAEKTYNKNDYFQLLLINNDQPYEGDKYQTTWKVTNPSGGVSFRNTSDGSIKLSSTGTWSISATITDRTSGKDIETVSTSITVK